MVGVLEMKTLGGLRKTSYKSSLVIWCRRVQPGGWARQVEPGASGQSILTDLVEFKGVRNDASLESDYLHGRYGAVPLVNQFQWAFIPV
jgi:hypothetical protein